MQPILNSITIYAKNVEAMIDFYGLHFGYVSHCEEGDRLIELRNPNGGSIINLLQAAKSQKIGQVLVKLVFDVQDVSGFREISNSKGLEFGPIHRGDGYVYSNSKDPTGNSISVSSRAFR